MTDFETPHTPSRLRKFAVPLLVGVAAIALIGFLASRSGLDKALLRQQLDEFASRLHEAGLKNGRDLNFTYKDVSIEGSFSHKHAVVHEPKLSVKPMQPGPDSITMLVSTPSLNIYPQSADLSAISVEVPQPIDFANEGEPEKKLLTIASDTPLSVAFAQSTEKDVNYLDINAAVPEKVNFTYLREHQAQGVEDATPTIVPVYQKLLVTAQAGGSVHTHLSNDGHKLGTVKVDMHNVHLVPEAVPNGEVSIAEIAVDTSNALNEKKENSATVKLHIGDITASPDFIPYAPLSLTMDGSYEGNATKTPEDVASIGNQQSIIKLNQFALVTKEAKLTANADFATVPADALPEGTANITLTNVPYVLKELGDNGILNDMNQGIVTPVLELTTGQKLGDIKDAVIDIKRQKGSAFMIGKVTFEELFAAVLKGALVKQSPTIVKPAPAIDTAPKAPMKGAMTVEDSARG